MKQQSTYNPDKHRSVRLDRELTEGIKKIADSNKISLTAQLNLLMKKEITKKGIEV